LDGGFKARRGCRGHAYIRRGRGRGMNRGWLSRENIGGNRGSNIIFQKKMKI
jgi:hypothetical protein